MRPTKADITYLDLKNSAVTGRIACILNSGKGVTTPQCNYKTIRNPNLNQISVTKTMKSKSEILLLAKNKAAHEYQKKTNPIDL